MVEFFFIRDPYGKWTFPKGHQELGETMAETAIREIEEETGLVNLKYIAPLGRTSFRFRREKTVIEKTVFLFLFEAAPDAQENLPGTEGITKAAWFKIEKARNVSGYRNLDRLFAKALVLTRNRQPQSHQAVQRQSAQHQPTQYRAPEPLRLDIPQENEGTQK